MKILSILRNKKLWFILVIVVIAVVVIYAWGNSSKETPTTETPPSYKVEPEVPKGQNTWEGVTPGSTLSDKVSVFGNEISKVSLEDGNTLTKYDLNRNAKYLALEVITDQSNAVQHIRVPEILISPNTSYLEYAKSQGLGTPDFEMYVKEEFRVKAYIFLSKGVEIEASEFSNYINYIDYFVPTDRGSFLQKWGSNLIEEYVPQGN